MAKWTDGWLCRGKGRECGPYMWFFTDPEPCGDGWWRQNGDDVYCWPLDMWHSQYDYNFRLPAQGKRVYVSIQL